MSEPHHTTAPAPRRRLDVEKRTAAILGAARERYAHAGFDDVSVAEVARAAGTSPALVFHYFGSKAGLHAAVVRASLADLRAAQDAAVAAAPPNTSRRDLVRIAIEAYLDHVTGGVGGVGGRGLAREPHEPTESAAVRREFREDSVAALARLLGLASAGGAAPRHDLALWGWLGFLDAAVGRWADAGFPRAMRDSLVPMALGALEGVIGDWGG